MTSPQTLLERAATDEPARTGLVMGEARISFEDWHRSSLRIAAGLRKLGAQPGERILSLVQPSLAHFFTYHAVARLGAAFVPVNPNLSAQELLYFARDSEAGIVLCDTNQAAILEGLRAQLPHLRSVVVVGDDVPAGAMPFSEWMRLDPDDTYNQLGDDEPFLHIYTGGTTGVSKGVVMPVRFMAQVDRLNATLRLGTSDTVLLALPLFHSLGDNRGHRAALKANATLIVHDRFRPERFLAEIFESRVSYFPSAPAVLARLIKSPEFPAAPPPSLRHVFVASAPFPLALREQVTAKLGVPVLQGYGTSELGTVTQQTLDDPPKLESIGRPISSVEVRLLTADGKDAATGEPGEIVVKSPYCSLGYYGRPEDSVTYVAKDWSHTGDLAIQDADGDLFIVGRLKDYINRGGEKIYPREVEEVLCTHPGVEEAAVVGTPDDDLGEEIHAFIVSTSIEVTGAELRAFCSDKLTQFKIPRKWSFVEELPRSDIGKVLYRTLRERDR